VFVEHAELTVDPEQAEQFLAAFEEGRRAIARSPGYLWSELLRGVERPDAFLLRVGWESVEAHTEVFRSSGLYTQWRAAVSPYFAKPPAVEHYADLGLRRQA
jgi:heme-degrading monooxygenase HmoA